MKLSHWVLLAASIMAILTLRLLLYYGMAHGRLDVLLHLYAVQQYDRHREVPFFNLLLDTLAPAILMGILNGRIGYRERSHGGVMAVSALLVIVNVEFSFEVRSVSRSAESRRMSHITERLTITQTITVTVKTEEKKDSNVDYDCRRR